MLPSETYIFGKREILEFLGEKLSKPLPLNSFDRLVEFINIPIIYIDNKVALNRNVAKVLRSLMVYQPRLSHRIATSSSVMY